jgi:SAM-dependent methyltransferase
LPDDFFERMYASGAPLPWDRGGPRAELVEWAILRGVAGEGRPALVVGCGLGDDAEFVAALGFAVTAFDFAPTAISMARVRHPGSWVTYAVEDVLAAPSSWTGAFALVVECLTVQSLPPGSHAAGIAAIGSFVAPGGTLLVIASAADEPPRSGPPWPLTRAEIESFALPVREIERLPGENFPLWRAEFTNSPSGQ